MKLALTATILGSFLFVGCGYTVDTDTLDRGKVEQTQSNISSVQPIPDLRYSTQRQTLIDAYRALSEEQPFFMIATNRSSSGNGADIIATAVVKGCVPATFQLTNPEVYEYNGATIPQAEINALFTGDTPATYCIGIDGTFFYVEHDVAFSTRPFSQAVTDSAQVNFTPNVKVNPDGTVTNTLTGESF